ncbi:caspase family protein [Flammeovirgaceae bacterium SG7u.111]|nr:caspase family protein [Flammeovirgaceae bacterium SG7u.132]WPO33185.1 caspase family protein [Flammeovirgaceae bacterium SG7u.111]
MPTGVNIQNKNDVDFECVSVSKIQRIMETSNAKRLNMIVLDACRNNPFRSWSRSGETGLADVAPPSGTLIAFATSPGSTASNGTGRNGLYTGEFINQLKKPQRIVDVFINTRVEVERKSGGRQSPWEFARLRGMYYLVK